MDELRFDGLSVTHGRTAVLHPCSATLTPNAITAIVGPNGAGKSTLLRAMAALIPLTGQVLIDDRDVALMPVRQRARILGYLPQQHDFAWGMPVRDMVALGRYAFGDAAPGDAATLDEQLAHCGISALADRPVDQLSGGERALAALARVLLADTPVLLLDEPVAALDVGRQYQILDHLAVLARQGKTVVAVLHDLAHVAQYADHILWVDQARLVAHTNADQPNISHYGKALLGRTPHWANHGTGKPVPYFDR